MDGYIDDIVIVDLTEMYGAGNELTKDGFEAIKPRNIIADKAPVCLMPTHNPFAYE